MLLSPSLLQKLSRLTLRSGRRGAGQAGGAHRSIRRGQSLEFADHRPYVPGDDLRFLDWHVYGRLDALWIKLFEEKDDRVVQLLVDCSGSMAGEKLDYARALAAALSWLALGGSDRVAVGGLSDRLVACDPPRRGRGSAPALFRTLEAVQPGGATDLSRALESWPHQRGTGLVLLMTDFLYPEGPDVALRRLISRGNDVHVFHLLAPSDVRPALDGDVVLVDAETGEELPATIDEPTLDRYEAILRGWAEEMAATCRRLGVGYTRVVTSTPVEELVLGELRRAGLVG
jgi:uncharacterized protein (DUF58 family)